MLYCRQFLSVLAVYAILTVAVFYLSVLITSGGGTVALIISLLNSICISLRPSSTRIWQRKVNSSLWKLANMCWSFVGRYWFGPNICWNIVYFTNLFYNVTEGYKKKKNNTKLFILNAIVYVKARAPAVGGGRGAMIFLKVIFYTLLASPLVKFFEGILASKSSYNTVNVLTCGPTTTSMGNSFFL